MATHVVLIDWTDQGVSKFQRSVERYEAPRRQFEQTGLRLRDDYRTLGVPTH